MSLLLLAQDPNPADGEFLTLCHRWGDVASVFGFGLAVLSMAITLIGFYLTLRGQRRIRAAAEAATRRAAYQVAVADAGTLLRQVEGVREAIRHRLWLVAAIRGSEARLAASSLANCQVLTEEEQKSLRDLAETLRLAVQYLEERLLPQSQGVGNLSAKHCRNLDRFLIRLAELRGRLQYFQEA